MYTETLFTVISSLRK